MNSIIIRFAVLIARAQKKEVPYFRPNSAQMFSTFIDNEWMVSWLFRLSKYGNPKQNQIYEETSLLSCLASFCPKALVTACPLGSRRRGGGGTTSQYTWFPIHFISLISREAFDDIYTCSWANSLCLSSAWISCWTPLGSEESLGPSINVLACSYICVCVWTWNIMCNQSIKR